MNRNEITSEIKGILGKVPEFLGSLPDDTLEQEWSLFKRFELSDSKLPPKYRELMGISIASVLHCWYCANFHKAMAEFNGATEEEIQEAVHFAKFSSGWSTYLNGMVYDKEKFINELKEIGSYINANVH